VKKANLARTICQRLAYPSEQSLAQAIRNSSISNLPITLNDLSNASATYGKDVAMIKGKSTAIKPRIPHPNNVNKMTEKYQSLLVDLAYVETQCYLISISIPLNLVMIDIASSKTALHLGQLLVETIDCYKSEGFIINCVKCDNESCLSAARQTINSRGATLSIAGIKSNGIAQIDRAIRLIKERVRCILHASPFHVG
jgi:hypothetical protein